MDHDPGTGTAALGYDCSTDVFVISSNPNSGTYGTIGRSGIVVPGATNLDIQTTGGRNVAYASMPQVAGTQLYVVNLTNGLMTPVGEIGQGLTIPRGLAIAPSALQFSAETYSVSEKSGAATITINASAAATAPCPCDSRQAMRRPPLRRIAQLWIRSSTLRPAKSAKP